MVQLMFNCQKLIAKSTWMCKDFSERKKVLYSQNKGNHRKPIYLH